MDPEQQRGTRQRTSRLEWTACASSRPPPPVDAETVKLDHFLFAFRGFRFLRRHWRGCGSSRDVHVDKRHLLHKLLRREMDKSGHTVHTLISRVTVESVSVGFSASGERSWCPVQRRVSFQKARTQNRSLESFQVRRCRMERYKNNDHAFLVGMLFVLMCVWLSAFVCICFVCLSPFESDGPSVCLCPSMSRGRGVCVSLCFF